MAAPMERIQQLDQIETDITMCLQAAGAAIMDLGKDKTSIKATEQSTNTFLKSLNNIERKLSDQISYLTQVSTGQPHEGSGYGAAKVIQMAWHRLEHARRRVNELDKLKQNHLSSTLAFNTSDKSQMPSSTSNGAH